MLEDLYNERILQHAANIPRTERLADPQASARKESRLCGSRVTVDLSLRDGVVSDYGQEVKACVLGQCSASLMGQTVIGQTPEQLRQVRDAMRAMLKEEGPAPQGDWAELEILRPAIGYRSRHASILLPFDAVVAALDEIEASRSQPGHIRKSVGDPSPTGHETTL